jgi:hypothetical protein
MTMYNDIIEFIKAMDDESYVDITLTLEPNGPSTGLVLCDLDKEQLRKLIAAVATDLLKGK